MDKRTNAILIHDSDNVITATEPLNAGGVARYQRDRKIVEITIIEEIPKFHKIAVFDIQETEPVRKYGQLIGEATKTIMKGSHVHVHNMASPKKIS